MNQNNQLETVTYKQLCDKFNEKPKNSGARSRQFERWKKTYYINKVDGKNQYYFRPLNEGELNEKQLYFNYRQILEPMIYKLLSEEKNSETTHSLIISPLDLMIKLGLVNNYYKEVRFNENKRQNIFQDTEILSMDINKYQREVDKLNKRTIKDVLNSMKSKDLIWYYDKFVKKILTSDNIIVESLMTNEETSELLTERRNISKALYGKEYELLEDNIKRNNVNIEVKKRLGLISYYSVYEIILNQQGICEDVKNNNYFYANQQQLANVKNQIRINKSKQGDLKLINQMQKEIITNRIINNNYKKGEQ